MTLAATATETARQSARLSSPASIKEAAGVLNTYAPSIATQPGARGTFLAVLAGTWERAGDVAVYVGFVAPLPDPLNMDKYETARAKGAAWIAAHGTKLKYRDALAYFPHLKERDYRA